MMMALRLKRAGRSVVLFESEDHLGGAWQVETVDGIGPVECACHLLEWYSGGYHLLTELSGVQFSKSNPQPVRVFPDGRVLPYTARSDFPKALYWATRSLAASLVRRALAHPDQHENRDLMLRDSWRHLLFQLRYRISGTFAYDGIQRPAQGYISFTEQLCAQIERSGINVVVSRIDSIDVRANYAALRYAGKVIEATKVYVGESTQIAADGKIEEAASEPEDYFHIVIGLPADKVQLRSDYVHLPEDTLFHRITYVRDCDLDNGTRSTIFLVQLRRAMGEIPDFEMQLSNLLSRCGIARQAHIATVHKEFTKRYMRRRALDTAPLSGPVLHRLRTIGDLARNVLLHARDFQLNERR